MSLRLSGSKQRDRENIHDWPDCSPDTSQCSSVPRQGVSGFILQFLPLMQSAGPAKLQPGGLIGSREDSTSQPLVITASSTEGH